MMKLFLILAISLLGANTPPAWEHDLQRAKQVAHEQHKLILLNFSGSDWCGPCIRLHKEIFDSESFMKYAQANLVMLNADFPRMKKNQLPKEQQKQNDELAEKYNQKGIFPYTLLLDEEGKVISTWEGFPNGTSEDFIKQISSNKN